MKLKVGALLLLLGSANSQTITPELRQHMLLFLGFSYGGVVTKWKDKDLKSACDLLETADKMKKNQEQLGVLTDDTLVETLPGVDTVRQECK